MKTILAAVVLLSLSWARADELRVAHFDAQKVFAGYQRAKDRSAALQALVSGGSHNGEDIQKETPELWKRYQFLMARLQELDKHHANKTDEQQDVQFQQYAHELRLLEMQVNEKKSEHQAVSDRQEKEEANQICREIWAAAAKFGKEHGYFAVVPENHFKDDAAMPNIIITAQSDDVTDALIEALNKNYHAEKKN